MQSGFCFAFTVMTRSNQIIFYILVNLKLNPRVRTGRKECLTSNTGTKARSKASNMGCLPLGTLYLYGIHGLMQNSVGF